MTLVELQNRLTQAETALHALATGSQVVEVSGADGTRTRFSEASIGQLRAYIDDLRAQVNTASSTSGRRRPIYFSF